MNGNQNDNSANDSGAAYIFVRNRTIWSQQAYLKASNTSSNDYFGWSVSISDETVVVGAYNEASNASGVNGNQSDNSASFSGAAYVFVRTGTNWSQQVYLKASNTEAYDLFGSSVAVSGDCVVVGALSEDSKANIVNGDQNDNSAFEAGAAYVFVRNGTNWTQQVYLKASNTGAGDSFGCSVAVSGETAAVGARDEASSATGVNGDQNNNSANGSGAAYVFRGVGPFLPQVRIDQVGNHIRIAWPASASGFVLDETIELASTPAATMWSEVPFPYETNNSQIFITLPTPSANKFYRLRRPQGRFENR